MDPKRLLIAVVVLAALGGVVWFAPKPSESDAAATKKDGEEAPTILEAPLDQISKVEIRRMGAEPVVLEKSANGWSLTKPQSLAADQDAVNALTGTLTALKSDRLVEAQAKDWKAYGLESPIITVIVTRQDGKSHTVHLGDDSPSGTGAFARLEGDPRLFTVASFTKTSLDKTWRDLRDKRLVAVDGEKLTRVELGSVEFGKNAAGNWTILKPRALRADNFATDELVRKLQAAKMESTNDTEEEASWPAKFAAAKPVGTAKLTDQKGTHTVEVRKGKENDYYAKSSDLQGVYKTTAELGEVMGKSLDDFRNKKPFEFGFNEPEKVEIKVGDQSYVFAKSGQEWKSANGKTVEAASVQQVIDRLRDLAATKFAESAGGAVAAEYAVTLPGGKTVERVVVKKQGEMYTAQRTDGGEVFVLDGKVVNEIRELAAGVKEAAPPAKPPDNTKK